MGGGELSEGEIRKNIMFLTGAQLNLLMELADGKSAAWRQGLVSQLYGYSTNKSDFGQDRDFNRNFYQGRKDARRVLRKR